MKYIVVLVAWSLLLASNNCFSKAEKNFDNFHVVDEGKCYRSAQLSEKKLMYYLKKFGIKTVINLRGKQEASWWYRERKITRKFKVALVDIAMHAVGLPSKEQIRQLLDAYQTLTPPCLLHCFHGSNRTGLAAAIWVLDRKMGTKQEALQQLSSSYGYNELAYPAKKEFISLWQGRVWALDKYDPLHYMPSHK